MASGPITSWKKDKETVGRLADFILGGSKISVDGDNNHKIRRYLILRRKTMTKLDSVLESRDITLPTKVHIVKSMVFPAVVYRCERWAIKKAECWRIVALEKWCLQIVVLKKTLESPLDSKETNSVNPKGNPPWIFIGRTNMMLKLKLQLLRPPDAKSWFTGKDSDGEKDWGQKKRVIENEMLDGITNWMVMSLSKLQEIVKDREAWHAALRGVPKSKTRLSDWTTLIWRRVSNTVVLSPWDLKVVTIASDPGWKLRIGQTRHGSCFHGGYTVMEFMSDCISTLEFKSTYTWSCNKYFLKSYNVLVILLEDAAMGETMCHVHRRLIAQ